MTTKSNELSNVISGIEPSLTMSITALAGKLRAEGQNVIGFGAGDLILIRQIKLKKRQLLPLNQEKANIRQRQDCLN